MYEKDLYPAVEQFLNAQNICLADYAGSELSLKRGKKSLRADVFGVSKGKLLYSKEEQIYARDKMETKLRLPHEIITICKVRENELESFLKKAIAIELFREGLVSIGKASEIADVSRNEMMDLLGERRIPLHYTVEDLEEDVKALRRI